MKKQPLFFRVATYVVPLTILLFISIVFKSCSKDSTPTTPAPVKSVQVGTDATLGSYLTDGKGFTIYFFAVDVDGVSKCAGGCLAVWPVFYDSLLSATTLGTGLKASDFTTITATSGAKQTAYKGWPLYYYAPKDASGNNVREAAGVKGGEKVGNTWFVVKTDYSIMLGDKKVGESGTTDSLTKEFLVDSAGNTLYYFGKDSLSPSTLPLNCTGACITTWPVFYSPLASIPSLLNKADFGTITRTDGTGGTNRLQSTYKGRPLYYFAPDTFVRGAVKGEGVGKIWFVTNPDVAKIN
jgi:predicted lipoprotein with Yx(FWY)xxD motif